MAKSGDLVTRNYNNFRGVDFSQRKDEVSLNRSPDALNVWKNYKNNNGRCIETRPDVELLEEYSNTIYGLFFYTYNGVKHRIVHVGDKLYDDDKLIYLTSNTGDMSSIADTFMSESKSSFFVFEKKLYIKDGTQYLVYDGTTCINTKSRHQGKSQQALSHDTQNTPAHIFLIVHAGFLLIQVCAHPLTLIRTFQAGFAVGIHIRLRLRTDQILRVKRQQILHDLTFVHFSPSNRSKISFFARKKVTRAQFSVFPSASPISRKDRPFKRMAKT